ncbi:type IV toxin-antitoxin system AbiEi family antitoxin domain-containing protein [Isoptericola jiangsuensis]|uniref:type IV toxin-antitoxin system AbiEi family antitoxin domain-containing protein n=1 Tax=Isoptericola jiangsuensis TaxID=548579 RepID=UPI000BF6D311|nr:type IV toxin-antitoxin system AbiEi family antitoxin domain-containing protein [Isoptericola jiangsuensis]
MSRPVGPLPPTLVGAARRQEGLVTIRQCLESGMSRRRVQGHVERKDWERPARGVYDTGLVVPTSTSDGFAHRRRRTALLGPLSHEGTVAVGVSALVLHGVQGSPVRFVPEVAAPRAAHRAPDGPVRVRRILVTEPERLDGVLVAPVVDSLALAIPTLSRADAVAMMDSALHQGLVTPAGIAGARARATGRRGARRCEPWWSEPDARSESPAESWARVTCTAAGVPPDAVQLVVVRGGQVVARVDLAWILPDGVVLLVEIDGRDVHSTPDALLHDRRRQNRIDTPVTMIRRFTGTEARDGTAAREVSAVLAQARWRPRPVAPGLAYCIERAGLVPQPKV